MNVNGLFERLSVAEFLNLSLSNDGSGEIEQKRHATIIHYANDALMELHSRFILSEKNVVIQMIDGYTNYYLLKRFAQSQCKTPPVDPVYIIDDLEPFEEDVIKILTIHDHLSRDVTLNDKTNSLSIFTPKYNMLHVPRPVEGMPLTVTYQAKHRKLEPGVLEAGIVLPDVLNKALFSYIAWQYYSNMNGQDNTITGQKHEAEFEKQCTLVLDRDLVSNTPDTTSEIFERNGWA